MSETSKHSAPQVDKVDVMDELGHQMRFPRYEAIQRASVTIDPVFRGTPLMSTHSMDEALGCHLEAKVETLSPIRSFKGRGASWFTHCSAGDLQQPLVTASVGNFGQGLAFAARSAGLSLTVFASRHANPGKILAMSALGAHVIQAGEDFDEAKAAAADHAESSGARLVVDGAEPAIAEGAGTIALELTGQHFGAPLDAVLVPIGNGALITGMGTWLKACWPTTRVIGVVAAGAAAMALSWEAGHPIETATTDTIADGLAVRVPIPYALDVMRETVDEVVMVKDTDIGAAMHLLFHHFGLVTEPAGAAGVAAVLADPERFSGQGLGTVLCGANVRPELFRQWALAEVGDGG